MPGSSRLTSSKSAASKTTSLTKVVKKNSLTKKDELDLVAETEKWKKIPRDGSIMQKGNRFIKKLQGRSDDNEVYWVKDIGDGTTSEDNLTGLSDVVEPPVYRTRMRAMVPVTKNFKRAIKVEKPVNQRFGIRIARIDGRIIVLYVDKFTQSESISAAYKCGIRWGDEILRINNVDCDSMNVGLIYRTLKAQTKINIEFMEQPMIEESLIFLDPERNRTLTAAKLYSELGLEIFNGFVNDVRMFSPADQGNVEVGTAVVRVNGNYVLGRGDRAIVNLICRFWMNPGDTIRLSTMSKRNSDAIHYAYDEMLRSNIPIFKGMSLTDAMFYACCNS